MRALNSAGPLVDEQCTSIEGVASQPAIASDVPDPRYQCREPGKGSQAPGPAESGLRALIGSRFAAALGLSTLAYGAMVYLATIGAPQVAISMIGATRFFAALGPLWHWRWSAGRGHVEANGHGHCLCPASRGMPRYPDHLGNEHPKPRRADFHCGVTGTESRLPPSRRRLPS